MGGSARTFVSGGAATRRGLREQREEARRLTIRHRWHAGGIAALVSVAMVLTGMAPATAEEVAPDSSTSTTESVDETAKPDETTDTDDSSETGETADPAPKKDTTEPGGPEGEVKPGPIGTEPLLAGPDALFEDGGGVSLLAVIPTDCGSGAGCGTLTITNSVVGGGPATSSSWTLRATDTTTTDWYDFTSGQTRTVIKPATYAISATPVDPALSMQYMTTLACTTSGTGMQFNNPNVVFPSSGNAGNRSASCTFTHTAFSSTNGPGQGAAPTAGRVTLTMNAGGDRSALNTIAPLAGVVFGVYAQGDTTPNAANLVAQCTTAASPAASAGRCWVNLPTRADGYLVAPISAPAGWQIVTELETNPGTSSSDVVIRPYRFHTGAANGTSAASRTFAIPQTGSGQTTSGGTWMFARSNPTAPQRCGLDVGLLVDLSSSVTSGSQTALRTAARTFVEELTGTPSQMAIHTFGTSTPAGGGAANANMPLTPLPSSGTVGNPVWDKANGLTSGLSNEWTNWDRGLWFLDPTSTIDFDVVLVLTDGFPTRYGGPLGGTTANTNGPSSVSTRIIEIEHAIASANAVKANTARLITVGIGDGLAGASNQSNLKAVSGAALGSDYFLVDNYAALQAFLRNLARAACEGTVNVTKQVIPVGGSVGQPASGWTFTAQATGPTVKLDGSAAAYSTSAAGDTNDSGGVGFRVDFSAGTSQATRRLSITEALSAQPGHVLTPFGTTGGTGPDSAHTAGDFARCWTTDAPTTWLDIENIGTTTSSDPGFRVDPVEGKTVACLVRNQALDLSAQLRVTKTWNVDLDGDGDIDTTGTGPNAPEGLGSASLQLSGVSGLPGTPQFGTVVSGLPHNGVVSLAEQVVLSSPLCTNEALVPASVTLTKTTAQGVNEAEIVNTITCRSMLTLVKNVVDGPAQPDEWILDAIAPSGALAGPSGVSGTEAATDIVTPGVVYPLAESATTALAQTYFQRFEPTLDTQWGPNHAAGSTGSWVCNAASSVTTEEGELVPVWSNTWDDGRNGGVTVGFGQWFRCTADNLPRPTLELVKKIDRAGVLSTDGATQWTLTAGGWVAPDEWDVLPYPTTQAPVSGGGGFATTAVLPGTYTLTESGPIPGYTNGTAYSCVVNDAEPQSVALGGALQLVSGDAATCEIVNTLDDVSLTLVKEVQNTYGGAGLPHDWRLTAKPGADPAVIDAKPANGESSVTASVTPGVAYTLSESDGPAGYEQVGPWTCVDDATDTPIAVSGNAVTPPVGVDVTCTVVNRDLPADVSIEKSDATVLQNADGEWELSYTVTVTNESDVAAGYTITDTPQFGPNFDVVAGSAHWTPGDITTDPTGTLAPGAQAVWVYHVKATVATGFDSEETVCETEQGVPGFFWNSATVTFPGGSDTDDGCGVPGSPAVDKFALPSAQDPVTGLWTIAYDVTVSNPSAVQVAYTLTDVPEAPLPAGVSGGTWTVSDPVVVGGGTWDLDEGWTGVAPDDTVATGLLPVGASHTYRVSRVVAVAASVPSSVLDCEATGGGIDNAVEVTNGVGTDTDDDCAEIDRPDVTIDKTVTSSEQLEDGTWVVSYEIVVTNASSTLAAVYDLTDELLFGAGISIVTSPAGLAPAWAGPTGSGGFTGTTATLATNRLLAPHDGDAGVETYTVTVHATIAEDAWSSETSELDCAAEGSLIAGGFLNTATVAAGGGEPQTADDCAEPSIPTIEKTANGAAVQSDDDPDVWTVSYTITVHPSGHDSFYTLEDVPGFPVGVVLSATGTAQRTDTDPDGDVLVIEPGTTFPADPVAIGASDAPHTWVVTWQATVSDGIEQTDRACGDVYEPGKGFYNNALLLQGESTIDEDDACIPVLERVYPTHTKTVTSSSQDAETGVWTIVYDIEVTLGEEGSATNPNGLSSTYSLKDELTFGGGIDVDVESSFWQFEGGAHMPFAADGTAQLALLEPIAAGATHTYTVTAVATVTDEATDDTTSCDPRQEGPSGGFLNVVNLTSGSVTTPYEACTEPLTPGIVKTGGVTTDNLDGTFDIEYVIEVSYPESDLDPLPSTIGYTLTDVPDLPDGVSLVGGWAASADGGSWPVTNPVWDGEVAPWTIVDAGTLTPDDATHTFVISATVRATAVPDEGLGECDDTQSEGIVIPNTATVTSGAHEASDDGCQTVQLDDVGLVKTSRLPAEQTHVEPGDQFDYVLTVTNHGTRAATAVRVVDTDLNDRLEIVGLVLDPALAYTGGYVGNDVDLTIGTLGVGASVEVVVTVRFLPPPAQAPILWDHDSDPETPPIEADLPPLVGDEAAPDAPLPLDELENTACVSTVIDPVGGARDGNGYALNCDDETIPTRDIASLVYTRCVNDAPLLGWVVTKSASLAGSPAQLRWEPNNSAVTPETSPPFRFFEQTDDALTWSGEVPWPGTAFTPSGISIDYPGWRPIQRADLVGDGRYYNPATGLPMTAEEQAQFVFNGLILDPSELDYAWRLNTDITITVNPTQTFSTGYPPATPECFVARHTEVQVEKTASVTRTDPGESFTYDIAVENVSDDSAADGVVVTDQIPLDIRVTGVSWVGQGDPDAFPTWETCAVTGQDAAGYGGTLECVLLGPLQPLGSNNGGATAAPTITLAVNVHPDSTATRIVNVAIVDYHTFGDPEDAGRDLDDASVVLGGLSATGGSPILPLIALGMFALASGVAALVITRRRKGEPQARL